MDDKLQLTVKQERFAQGLMAGMTQRDAYKLAYNSQNMTNKSIDEKACELAANDKVVSRLSQLTDELKIRNIKLVEKTLAELAKIGFADIKQFLSYETVKTVIGTADDGTPILGYRPVINLKPSDEVDGSLISQVSITKDGTLKFKLHDKIAALEKIGKYLGMFVDKVEGNVKIEHSFESDLMDLIRRNRQE